jgi:hypothetical protein
MQAQGAVLPWGSTHLYDIRDEGRELIVQSVELFMHDSPEQPPEQKQAVGWAITPAGHPQTALYKRRQVRLQHALTILRAREHITTLTHRSVPNDKTAVGTRAALTEGVVSCGRMLEMADMMSLNSRHSIAAHSCGSATLFRVGNDTLTGRPMSVCVSSPADDASAFMGEPARDHKPDAGQGA